ncbi:metallophosphoesterase [Proteus mirabilis]|uniref:metallophosphoesterase n=1 Tax=Proteus mirabilis TaxID=584 RepID=UPI0034E3915D
MVISLLPNKLGRDFVVGDIHGCYDEFECLLSRVKFDSTKDRVISVGDLIDRGKDSVSCIKLLDKPWFYIVLGNHEQAILDWYQSHDRVTQETYERKLLHNGSSWFLALSVKQQQQIYNKLKSLPKVIFVNNNNKLYCILHAEIIPEINDINVFLKNIVLLEDKSTLKACLEGRRRSRAKYYPFITGIDYLLCGHTPCFNFQSKNANTINLDFGAGSYRKGATLGMIDLTSHSIILQPMYNPY